jgi:ribosomal protein S18 acetylase RimI-like enzyme
VTVVSLLALAGIYVRPEIGTDLDFLFELYASTRDDINQLGWDPRMTEAFLRHQFLAKRSYHASRFPAAELAIVDSRAGSVGRLALCRTPHELHIIDIALLPDWRNEGIGTVLVGAILDEARSAGRTVTLQVDLSNPARRLYQRLGFVESSTDGLYVAMRCNPEIGTRRSLC